MDILTIFSICYLIVGYCISVIFDDSIEKINGMIEYIAIALFWPVMIICVSVMIKSIPKNHTENHAGTGLYRVRTFKLKTKIKSK